MTLDIRTAALSILVISVLTIIGAWVFEWAGYAPCPLCLMQRWAYYAAIPLSIAVAVAAERLRTLAQGGLLVIAAIMIAGAVFAAYHAGIEWKFWPGPASCAGEITGGLPNLTNEPVIGCDEAALRILGVSLAGWNAVISVALAAIALIGSHRRPV
jgi:disulfide bond formation protein DsbB